MVKEPRSANMFHFGVIITIKKMLMTVPNKSWQCDIK